MPTRAGASPAALLLPGVAAAALALAPIIARAAPAAPRDGPTRTFGDWLAACDNGGDCSVYGFGADDSQATLLLALPRGSAPAVTLILQPDPALRPVSIRLQATHRGPAVTVRLAAGRAAGRNGGASRGILSAGEVAALLPGLRGGGRLLLVALPGPGGHAQPVGAIRLSGAGAALDWIADRQRHPPEPLPVAASAPAVDIAQPDPRHVPAVVAGLPAVRACRRQDDDDPAADTAAWALGGSVSLWRIACGSGNFDRDTLFVLQGPRPGEAAPAAFGSLAGMMQRPPGMLANAETTPDGRELIATEPSRGLGDCGDVRSYRWDGMRFRLREARLMTACRGLAPEDWPLVYRSRG